jgi:hypothetical protein
VLLPGAAPAQTSGYAPRLLTLQQQNAFQQQQSAVQNALQQTNILVQTAQQQNGTATSNSMSTPSTMSTSTSMPTVMVLQAPIAFQQQQMALQMALQQTRTLLQTGRQQRNPAVTRTALGQLNTLQAVSLESLTLQTSFVTRGGVFTAAQLLQLFQEQSRLSSLLTNSPAAMPKTMSANSNH